MSTAVAVSTQVQGDLQLQRSARALIGWMPPDEAAQWLAGQGQRIAEEHRESVRRARSTVATRSAGHDPGDPVAQMPDILAAHRDALLNNSQSASFFAEGWDVAIVDLTRVCVAQPHILTDDATARVADVRADDILSVASITLPIAQNRPLAAAFNEQKQTWIFSSANPNLRIAAHVAAPVQPGIHAFGFVVMISASYVQVARYRDRFLLRDGYHRAFGLLARGITHVPVFVRDFQTFDDMRLPLGLLPQDAYLGDRPPLLSDYSDNTVSSSVVMPVTQKVVMVQGVEVATLG